MKLKLALFVLFSFFVFVPTSFAACSFAVTGATSTISSSCSFDGADDGLDAGTGTTNTSEIRISGGTLTILGNQQISIGKITLTGGSLAIIDGGKILLNRIIYYVDKDNDGYSTAALPVAGSFGNLTPTPIGLKRKAAFTPTGVDCNDTYSTVKISHAQCYTDNDTDGYTTGLAANSTCLSNTTCTASAYASASTDGAAVTTHTGAGQWRDAANGNDCNDASSSVYQNINGYVDADGDGQGLTGSALTPKCSGAALLAGWSANNTDCYDGNINAKTGQTGWFTSNRGDGSYDYNCVSGNEYQYTAIYSCSTTGCAVHHFSITNGWLSNPGCGNTGTWKAYGAGGTSCTVNVAGAGVTCPATTNTARTQGCH